MLARAHAAAGAHACAAAALRPFLGAGPDTRYFYAACFPRAGGGSLGDVEEALLAGAHGGGAVAAAEAKVERRADGGGMEAMDLMRPSGRRALFVVFLVAPIWSLGIMLLRRPRLLRRCA